MTANISLQLYTLREQLAADPDATLARIAEIGFRSVELFGLDTYGDAYAVGLAKHGLSAPSVHASLVGVDDQAAALDRAAALGSSIVIEPFVRPEHWKDSASVEKTAESLNAAAELASARGLRVGYHNHNGEFRTALGEGTAFDRFVSLLDPRVVLEVDAYWVAAGGEDVVAFVTRNADRIKLIHVKDGSLEGDLAAQPAAGEEGTPEHLAGQLPAGEGVVPIAAALDAVPELEYAVVEFDVYSGDVYAGITAGREFLVARGLA
jgi:sugar phosphate isomerase/epimerase